MNEKKESYTAERHADASREEAGHKTTYLQSQKERFQESCYIYTYTRGTLSP